MHRSMAACKSTKGDEGERVRFYSAESGWITGNGRKEVQTKIVSFGTYMIAYNQAMKDTHNPSMAAQIAGAVEV